MIYLALVRIANCEICTAQWILDDPNEVPLRCKFCGSRVWMFGAMPRDHVFIRQGHLKVEQVLNKGAKSLGRREWSRKNPFGQGKDQKSRKAVDAEGEKSKENDERVVDAGENGLEDS